MKNSINNIFSSKEISGYASYLLISLAYVLIFILFNSFIYTDDFFINNLSKQLTYESVFSFIELREKYLWVIYIFPFLIIPLKALYNSVWIGMGFLLQNLDVKFKELFKKVLIGELIFLVSRLLHFVVLYLNKNELTLNNINDYTPLSLISYYGTENVVTWLQFPLKSLNLFVVIYILVIAWLLSMYRKEDFMVTLSIVLPYYLIGFMLWLVSVTFLTLQVS